MEPLPLCALCGEPLHERGHVLMQWNDRPGKPTAGWHLVNCMGTDLVLRQLARKKRESPTDQNAELAAVRNALAAILDRGVGRIQLEVPITAAGEDVVRAAFLQEIGR